MTNKIKVKLFAHLKEKFGSEVIVEVSDGEKIMMVLQELSKKLAGLNIIDEKGKLAEGLVLYINGEKAEEGDLLKEAKDGMVLALLPPMSGGYTSY